jgi:hypothetical protein
LYNRFFEYPGTPVIIPDDSLILKLSVTESVLVIGSIKNEGGNLRYRADAMNGGITAQLRILIRYCQPVAGFSRKIPKSLW